MVTTTHELPAEKITFSIPTTTIVRLKQTAVRNPIIGQDRALSALELGLGISADGYNIFIMGASGTGRRTLLTKLLKNYKVNTADLQDCVYVYNFTRPLEPKALLLPSGGAAYFKKTLQAAIESIRRQLLQIAKTENFASTSKKLISISDVEESQLLSDFEYQMAIEGFKLIQIKDDEARSMDLVPFFKGKTIPFEELQEQSRHGKFSVEKLSQMRENYYRCLDRMSDVFGIIRDKRRATDKAIRALKAQSAAPIIDNELASLMSLYSPDPKYAKVIEHLNAIREDLLSKITIFTESFKSLSHKKNFYGRYQVTSVCDHSPESPYIIQEEVPSFANLFGSIEPSGNSDEISHNGHLRLRPGAVHRASGGFLVLRLQDLLMEESAWPYLKRVLQSGKIEIQTPPTGNHIPSPLKPQALPISFKVIIIGGENSYDFLYQEDPDFQKLFKVCAEFDSVMPLTDTNMASLIDFVDDYSTKIKTIPIDDSGMARILSHAARLSEDRTMLTTRFTLITDLITEADYQAKKQNLTVINSQTITETIEHRRFLQRLPEEKYSAMIRAKEILLDVTGEKIGKVNGLAVHDRGYHAFGIPVVVTAQAAPGNKGVINIERESGLSGEIYDKAHLIIQGLLHRKFAKDIPLAVSASICFEQSYTEVDGDSASCAEFAALLSAIAQIPLRQDIAITGSLNQIGDVQPVGGIPEKIEGFFETCSLLGLTGTQGVIIPRRNFNHVLLSDKVEKAITDKLFHLWAIDTIEDGLEILSGVESATFRETVYEILKGHAERMQKFNK